jgi:hypothetical protein
MLNLFMAIVIVAGLLGFLYWILFADDAEHRHQIRQAAFESWQHELTRQRIERALAAMAAEDAREVQGNVIEFKPRAKDR